MADARSFRPAPVGVAPVQHSFPTRPLRARNNCFSRCASSFVPMATLTIELPPQETQRSFNLRHWAELLNDPELAKIEGRIETDRHGHIIMSPPPAPSHGSYQSEIAHVLRNFVTEGRVITECPISTADGVKAADVALASPESMRNVGNRA